MKFRRLILLGAVALLAGCNDAVDPDAAKGTFTKFYDDSDFGAVYYPIDVAQTSDGGFLVLAATRVTDAFFLGTYLMKTDEEGNFVADYTLADNYVNPIGDLMALDGKLYFFCMDAFTLQTQLVQVSEDLGTVTETEVGAPLYYPSASAAEASDFILLSYDHVNKQSVLSIVQPDGQVSISKGFDIGAGDQVDEPIINHFIHTGRQFPFSVGKAGNLYFFNGFYNYTFSLVFVDFGQDAPVGVVQGQQDDGGFSAVTALGGTFAAARFNFGDNYFLPDAAISTSGFSSSVDLGGHTLPELEPDAPVHILPATVKGKALLIFGSNTRSKQIGLYFYDAASGDFLDSRYLGFSNPFEVASLRNTADNGVIVCGTTYLAGRFPRIALFKLSEEALTPDPAQSK